MHLSFGISIDFSSNSEFFGITESFGLSVIVSAILLLIKSLDASTVF